MKINDKCSENWGGWGEGQICYKQVNKQNIIFLLILLETLNADKGTLIYAMNQKYICLYVMNKTVKGSMP